MDKGKIELDPAAMADPVTGVQPTSATLEAVLTKADGTVVDLGVIAEWHADDKEEADD